MNSKESSPVSELVERVRYCVGNPSAWGHYDEGKSELLRDAADRLTALEAENARKDAEIAHLTEIGSKAIKFRFAEDLFVESRGVGIWAVTDGSSVLNADGEWEYEPLPSSRTDEFKARTRFSFADAVLRAQAITAPQGGNHG